LFLTLLLTYVKFGVAPVWSAVASVAVALICAGFVAMRTVGDDDDDDVTQDSRTSASSDQPPQY